MGAQVALGYEKLYEAQNPFDWMELISLQVLICPLHDCTCKSPRQQVPVLMRSE
jgi:hypothetical protein